MSIIREALEDKLDKLFENKHEYESSVAQEEKMKATLEKEIAFLDTAWTEANELAIKIKKEKLGTPQSISINWDNKNVDTSKAAETLVSSLGSHLNNKRKELKELPDKIRGWRNRVAEIEYDIEQIREELKKLK